MKRKIKFLIAITAAVMLMCALAVTASASSSGQTGEVYFNVSGGVLNIFTSGTNKGATADYTSYASTPWSDQKFTSVKIGENVTGIGNYCFRNNTAITSVELPSTLRKIGHYAFAGTSISSVTLPEKLTDIGYGAFNNCKNLSFVFYNAKNCKTANGSNSVVIFGSPLKNVILGNTVQSIGDYMFAATSLTSVTLPDSVGKIGDGAFAQCASLATVGINSTSKLYSVGDRAFSKCTKLANISLPKMMTEIGDEAFASTAITSLDLTYHVTKIGADAFEGTNVTINTTTDAYACEYCKLYGVKYVANSASYGDIGTVTPSVEQYKFENATVSRYNGKITIFVKFDSPLSKECVHVAYYNSNDRVVDYIILPAAEGMNLDHMYVYGNDVSDAAYAKIFVWDSLETLRPVSQIKRVEITNKNS